jgi:hypothetical protein
MSIDWFESLAGFLVGVLVGWLPTYWNARWDEVQGRIESLCGEIDKCNEMAIAYWGDPQREPDQRHIREALIQSKISIIAEDIYELDRRYANFSFERKHDDLVLEWRRAITDGNFGTTDIGPNPDRIRRIETTSSRLRRAVRDGRRSWRIPLR